MSQNDSLFFTKKTAIPILSSVFVEIKSTAVNGTLPMYKYGK